MTYIVEAVDEAVKLLFLVMQHPSSGVTDLAKKAGLPKMRAFRLLSTLEHTGLIAKDKDSEYHLAYRSLVLGAAARKQLDLARVAAPFVEKLGYACGETVVLRVLDGLETLSIDCFLPEHSVRVNSTVGNRRPAHVGASGRLLLAFSEPQLTEHVVEKYKGVTIHEAPVDSAALAEELRVIRAQGYAVHAGAGYLVDAVAVAVPIFDSTGRAIAALTIACPYSRSNDERLKAFVEMNVAHAREISAALGYRA